MLVGIGRLGDKGISMNERMALTLLINKTLSVGGDREGSSNINCRV